MHNAELYTKLTVSHHRDNGNREAAIPGAPGIKRRGYPAARYVGNHLEFMVSTVKSVDSSLQGT